MWLSMFGWCDRLIFGLIGCWCCIMVVVVFLELFLCCVCGFVMCWFCEVGVMFLVIFMVK